MPNTMLTIANIFVTLFLVYVTIGVLFGLVFVFRGVQKLDTGMEGAGWGMRLLLVPGSMAFWPYLLIRWIKNRKHE